MRRFSITLLLVAVVHLQAQQLQPPQSAVLQSVQDSKAQPRTEKAETPIRTSFWDFLAPYRTPTAPALRLGPADRARSLVRNGSISLSLYDAVALTIENNLDIEV